MSHRRHNLIIAPDSPPATPPREGGQWPSHHIHPRYYQPSQPRVIVQRSTFTVPSHAHLVGRSSRDRNSSRLADSYSSSASPNRPSQPSSMGTPLFKLDEDHPQLPSRGYSRRRNGKQGSLRRSESLEFFPRDADDWQGRYGESEPNPSTLMQSMASSSGAGSSSQNSSSSGARRSIEFTRATSRRSRMVPQSRSAPIKIPSREKLEAERKKQKAAKEKAKQVAQRNSQHSRTSYNARRPADVRLGHYSSDESDDEYTSGRR